MMHKTSFIFVFFLCVYSIQAQEVISCSGDYYEFSGGTLSWTIGECITESFTNNDIILTQGFQQSNLSIVSISEPLEPHFTLQLFPNPTHENLTVQIDDFFNLKYRIYDSQGKLIMEGEFISEESEIKLSHAAHGIYHLNILRENKLIGNYKIVKY
jgi:hypothetical protein